jgi:hypothetical protein
LDVIPLPATASIGDHHRKGITMPRFYFGIRTGCSFVPDSEVMEFPDLDTAEREAVKAAASIAREWLPTGDARKVMIEVRDEQGERVLTVTVAMHIARSAQATGRA